MTALNKDKVGSNEPDNLVNSDKLVCDNCGEILSNKIKKFTISGIILTILGIGGLIGFITSVINSKYISLFDIITLLLSIILIWSGTLRKSYLRCNNCGTVYRVKE